MQIYTLTRFFNIKGLLLNLWVDSWKSFCLILYFFSPYAIFSPMKCYV